MKPALRILVPRVRAYSIDQTRLDVLSLMRKSAQPVAVITAILPATDTKETRAPVYHGATLSSFTSVSMHPHPLVAFSLRTPSRMAESLHRPRLRLEPHMVISLLSAPQARLALQFSRPHEYRDPFASTPYFLSHEGIPILRGCLGALSCALVGSWPLGETNPALVEPDTQVKRSPEEQGSELFLARVLRVEGGYHADAGEEKVEEDPRPLVYYRQQYVTVQDTKLMQLPEAGGSHKWTP